MIGPDLLGSDEDLARRVLVRARSIAPCIDSFPDGSEEQKNVLAILRAVMAEIPKPGSGRVRSKSRNGTSISYSDPGSWFTADDVSALRSLGDDVPITGPIGSFPTGRVFGGVWPEESYS